LGDKTRQRWGRHDLGHHATLTGRPIAVAAKDAPMGANRNLQNRGVLRTPEGLEGQVTLGTATVGTRKLGLLDHGGQMAVIAPAMPPPTALLTTRPPGGGRRSWRPGGLGLGGRRRSGLATKVWLLAKRELRLEWGSGLLELGFALGGAAVHGPPIRSLLSGLELFL